MKINKNFVLKKMTESLYVVIPVNEASKKLKGYINLNETSAKLFEVLSSGATLDDLVKFLVDNYEVEESVAKTDANNFVNKLKQIVAIND